MLGRNIGDQRIQIGTPLEYPAPMGAFIHSFLDQLELVARWHIVSPLSSKIKIVFSGAATLGF